MAHRDESRSAALAEVGGMLEAYVEGLREAGARTVEADPALLRAALAPPAPRAAVSAAGASAPAPAAAVPPDDPAAAGLAKLAAEIAGCTKCPLHRTRTRTVPGQGHPHPDILFIGEGPGRDEDRQGLAFVGRAGELLTRLIEAMGYTREQVFIGNIVKCRPTVDGAGQRDRPPEPAEVEACLPYLKAQIAHLRPKIIVLLGNVSLGALFGFTGITRRRGQWLEFEGIPVMPTYHPSYLLRGGGEDRGRYWDVWDDMMAVLGRLGRRPPREKRRPA